MSSPLGVATSTIVRVGKQSKHSHNYRHSNQSLDDERYNRMSTGPESPLSRAFLRRSDAEPAAWLELFFCEGTRAAPSVTRTSRMGFCFELEPIRRARPWRHREERPGSCLFWVPSLGLRPRSWLTCSASAGAWPPSAWPCASVAFGAPRVTGPPVAKTPGLFFIRGNDEFAIRGEARKVQLSPTPSTSSWVWDGTEQP